MKRFALPICLLLLAALPALADDKAKPVAVPFEILKTGHMAIMVKVDGKGPYRVIFDTGAPVTLLSTKLAKEAGLAKGDRPSGLLGMLMPQDPVTIKALEVGDLKAEKVPAMVMDHPTVGVLAKELGPLEGIVGFPFFARYRLTLDYQAKQMTLVPTNFDPPDVMKSMMATVEALLQNQKPKTLVLVPAAQWGIVVAKDRGDDEAGVTVKEVLAGSAAAQAGLKPGDRLLILDSRWTDSVHDTYIAAASVKPGTTVKVTVKRDGKEMELTVKPDNGL